MSKSLRYETAPTADEYLLFARDLYEEATQLFSVANREYSSDAVWTTNFDMATQFLRMRLPEAKPRDAVIIYLMKSLFSIAKGHTERQSMRSRYLDAINYLTFMAWMDDAGHDSSLLTTADFEEDEYFGGIEAGPEADTDADKMRVHDHGNGQYTVDLPAGWPTYGETHADELAEKQRRRQQHIAQMGAAREIPQEFRWAGENTSEGLTNRR